MSIMCVREVNEIPIEFVEYAMTRSSENEYTVIMRMEDEEGFHFIATPLESDLGELERQGYRMIAAYSPDIHSLYDNKQRYTHSDDRCC